MVHPSLRCVSLVLALALLGACGGDATESPEPGTDAGATPDAPIADGSGADTGSSPDGGATDAAVDANDADGQGGGPSDAEVDADTGTPELPGLVGCGDGVVDGIEQCDDGAANSDTAPNACRTDCRLARCGDAVVDDGETCDDRNRFAGDGCSPACQAESSAGEVEPNNTPATATPLTPGTAVLGGLSEADIDCFAVTVEDAGWIQAVTSSPEGGCTVDTQLRIFNPAGVSIASDADSGENNCSAIDPASVARARYLEAGTYAVCVEGFLRVAVPAYALTVTIGNDSCERYEASAEVDNDADGDADPCDPDDDNDDVLDASDNCPEVPNGAEPAIYRVNRDGFLQQYLILAGPPQTGGTECLPTDLIEVTDDITTFQPEIGEGSGGFAWTYQTTTTDRIDLAARFRPNTNVAAWVAAYVIHEGDAPRDVELAIGSDDGVRVWWNGVEVFETQACRGVTVDANRIPVTLQPGSNLVLMKVRNNSGGWGVLSRFREVAGAPITGLEIRTTAGEVPVNNQVDTDADGVGDLCDPTP